MAPGGVVPGRVAMATFALATAVVLVASLREAGARLALRAGGGAGDAAAQMLASDAELAAERASARLDEGDTEAARRELSTALAGRPRDPFPILLLASTTATPAERLRLALEAARCAPYTVEPARVALSTAIDAAEANGARAATARETARRLREAGVGAGVDEALGEAVRLERDAAALLDAALAVHGATSPTARGMRFLEDDVARVRELLRDAEGAR